MSGCAPCNLRSQGYCAGCAVELSQYGVDLTMNIIASAGLCGNSSAVSGDVQVIGSAVYKGQTLHFNNGPTVLAEGSVVVPVIGLPHPMFPIVTIGVKVTITRLGSALKVEESVNFDEHVASQSIPVKSQTIPIDHLSQVRRQRASQCAGPDYKMDGSMSWLC